MEGTACKSEIRSEKCLLQRSCHPLQWTQTLMSPCELTADCGKVTVLTKVKWWWEGRKWPRESHLLLREGRNLLQVVSFLLLAWAVRGCLACGMKNTLGWIWLVRNTYKIEPGNGGHILIVQFQTLNQLIFKDVSLRSYHAHFQGGVWRDQGRQRGDKWQGASRGRTIPYTCLQPSFKRAAPSLCVLHVRLHFRKGSLMKINGWDNCCFLGLTWNLLK